MDKFIKQHHLKQKLTPNDYVYLGLSSSTNKSMSRQKQVQIMMKEFQLKQIMESDEHEVSLPAIKLNRDKYKEFLNSSVASKANLDQNSFSNMDTLFMSKQAYNDESIDERRVLASSKGGDKTDQQSNGLLGSTMNQRKINMKSVGGKKGFKKLHQRSKSILATNPEPKYLSTKNTIQTSTRLDMQPLGRNKDSVRNSLDSQIDKHLEDQSTKKEFFETFNPSKKDSDSQSQNPESIDQTIKAIQENHRFFKLNLQSTQKREVDSDKFPSSEKKQRQSSNIMQKLILSDYTNPKTANHIINGQFSKTDRTIINKRQASVIGHRDIGHVTNRSIFNDSVESKVKYTSEGKFGLSFENVKKQYFKEYHVELFGKHSPGPAKYSPLNSNFRLEKFDSKSMPKEKRVCPIVPKHHSLLTTSPFSYDNKISAFQKHKNYIQYFGTKAQRKIDITLFAQQHAFAVQKGLF